MRRLYNHIHSDSLYRNSYFLILSSVLSTGLGFFFWGLATRVFTAREIGIASTIISASDLLVAFSLLGLNIGLVRYLPTSKLKNEKIYSVFTVIAISSVITSLLFIFGIKYFSPELEVIRNSIAFSLLFILFVGFQSFAETFKSIFRAYRSSELVLLKNGVFNLLKLTLLIFFSGLGAFGIFTSWLAALVVSVAVSFAILNKKFNYTSQFRISKKAIEKMFSFSIFNYISEFFERLPKSSIPIILTNLDGPESAAYYYLSMSIANFLFMLPESIASSFYAESSNNEKATKTNTLKALKAIAIVLIPSVILTFTFGKYILLFFGEQYSEGGVLTLQLFSLSTVFIAANAIFSNIARVKHLTKLLVFTNIVGALTIVFLSYSLAKESNFGIGLAWIIGNGAMTLIYTLAIFKYRSS